MQQWQVGPVPEYLYSNSGAQHANDMQYVPNSLCTSDLVTSWPVPSHPMNHPPIPITQLHLDTGSRGILPADPSLPFHARTHTVIVAMLCLLQGRVRSNQYMYLMYTSQQAFPHRVWTRNWQTMDPGDVVTAPQPVPG
jgi:hypothetical protein